jgi:hypothetical protein
MKLALVLPLSVIALAAGPAKGQSLAANSTCTGWIAVESTPESEGHILLDGQPTGLTSPATLKAVACGSHTLEVEKPLCLSRPRKIQVQDRSVARARIDLAPNYGHLAVQTDPRLAARVLLDGTEVGQTPLLLRRTPSGTHTITMVREFYLPYEATVLIQDGATTAVTASLKPNYGTLVLASDPTGALASVDGQAIGRTPVSFRVEPGKHRIRLEPADLLHRPVERTVRIKILESQPVSIRLPVRTGQLLVDTLPYAAEIWLDQKPVGPAPLSRKGVPIGSHLLTAASGSGPSLTRRIEIREGEISVAEINLKDPERTAIRFGVSPFPAEAGPQVPRPATTATDRNTPGRGGGS